MQRPPNVIFILCDDLGWGDLGCYGHLNIKTPNIDRLAAKGTLFTQFYSASPVCSPSRAAFLTGQFPGKLGIHDYLPVPLFPKQVEAGTVPFLDPQAATFPRLLQEAGYATAHLGKWHLGDGDDAPQVNDYGFDYCRTTHGNGHGFGEWWKDTDFRSQSSAMLVDEAIKFIDDNQDKPFCLNLWTLDPHSTLNPSPEQMAPYEHIMPKAAPYPGAMAIYYGTVTNLDTQIGRLLTKLDEQNLTNNTIILFSSDNGPEDITIPQASHSAAGSTGPFRGRKRSLYDGGIRMPFIARWPGVIPAGVVNNDSMVSAVDFLPTLAAITNSSLPECGDGEDISDILRGSKRNRSKSLCWEHRFGSLGDMISKSPQLAIREGDWKLLMNRDGSRVELYNLTLNPLEVDNLAEHHPELVRHLSQMLLKWSSALPLGEPTARSGKNEYAWPGR